jgi:uncharacterized protein (TIRG00374 family)
MPSFKNTLFFLITLTLGIIFFVLISGRVDWSDVGNSLSLIRPWQFGLLFALNLAILASMTTAWQKALRYMGYPLSWRKLWRIMVVGFVISFLTPIAFIGGEALVLYLLKREMNVPWRRGINSIIVSKLADFVLHIFFIVSGLIIFFLLLSNSSAQAISYLILIPVGVVGLIFYFFSVVARKDEIIRPVLRFFRLNRLANSEKVSELAKEEKEIISFFDLRQKRSRALMGATLMKFLFTWTQGFCLFFFITGQASLLYSLVVYAFSGLSTLFLLPATLGSLELLQVLAFNTLGFGSSAAISFSLVWRGMRLLIVVLSPMYFFYFASQATKEKLISVSKKTKKLFSLKKTKPPLS